MKPDQTTVGAGAYFMDSHMAAVARANVSPPPAGQSAPPVPWTPQPPTEEPWLSAYLALSPKQQRLWDSLSPTARVQRFGI